MVREGLMEDGWLQLKHYDRGVGTGVLDRITGGGFGLGLDENVKEAVDWLIEHYNDGDEIYIFGFSRGAYTARSLVAFIAKCGLLHRAAPLTVNQLWEGYRALGRNDDDLMNWWEKLFGVEEPEFRQLADLRFDDWRGGGRVNKGPAPNRTEELLMHWSRRVKITFLGIFDTVGAMGVEALAIPGLRSKLSMHHNMRLTSIVQHAYHALAIDEHRSSFTHIPLQEYVPNNGASRHPDRRVTQRWFIGAHSNIGGGYPDNLASLLTLRWMVKGVSSGATDGSLRLCLEAQAVEKLMRDAEPSNVVGDTERMCSATAATLVDSYSEFASPLWVHVIRGKRNYRPIAPPPETRGNPNSGECGYALRSIGDQLDDSVKAIALADAAHGHVRPNLVEYLRRSGSDWASQLAATCHHEWEGAKKWGAVSLALWCIAAAFGMRGMNEVFGICKGSIPISFLAALAAYFTWVDWAESRVKFSLARKPAGGFWEAVRSCVFWQRALGVMLIVAGVGYFVQQMWRCTSWPQVGHGLWTAWPVVVAAVLAQLPLRWTDKLIRGNDQPSFDWKLYWPALLLLIAVVVTPVVFVNWSFLETIQGDTKLVLAGPLLLLVLACLYYQNSFSWVGEPLAKARLNSIVKLQFSFTPKAVTNCLTRWSQTLERDPLPGDPPSNVGETKQSKAARLLADLVGESLWRDVLGFIPVYTYFFIVGIWFAQTHLHWLSGQTRIWFPGDLLGLKPWHWLPLLVAGADYIEDAIELRIVRRFGRGETPVTNPLLSFVAAVATLTKFVGFFTCLSISLCAILAGAWRLIWAETNERSLVTWFTLDHGGWTGWLAMSLGLVLVLGLFVQGIAASKSRDVRAKDGSTPSPTPPSSGAHLA